MKPDRPSRMKEVEFHDQIYSVSSPSKVRERTARFYSIVDATRTHYLNHVQTRCKGSTILEYGCGLNTYAHRFSRLGARVTSIDISPVAVEKNKEKMERENVVVDVRVMDAQNLEFSPGSFDLVCGVGIIHHLDIHRSLTEIRRVLKSSGTAVFIEPLGHNPFINWYRRRTPELRSSDCRPLLAHQVAVTKEYFDRVDLTYYYLFALAGILLPKGGLKSVALAVLNRIDRVLFALFPFLRKHAWATVIEMYGPKPAAATGTS